jgi:hypothetical protein
MDAAGKKSYMGVGVGVNGEKWNNQQGSSASSRKLTAVPWTLCGAYLHQIKSHSLQEAMQFLD